MALNQEEKDHGEGSFIFNYYQVIHIFFGLIMLFIYSLMYIIQSILLYSFIPKMLALANIVCVLNLSWSCPGF